MKLELRNNKDFWAGLLLIGMGSGAMIIARNYRFGGVTNMGPGFFPTVLGGLLTAFGLCILIMGLLRNVKIQRGPSLRVLITLTVALILFGILLEHAGFLPAMVTLVFLSATAGREFKVREALVLTGVMTFIMTAVFIWGLGLPYPLIKGF
jgi:Ca2+/Na+ antiporter